MRSALLLAGMLFVLANGAPVGGAQDPAREDVDQGARLAQIWRPTAPTSWQYQLSDAVNTTHMVTMYDIDLFEATTAEIAALHANAHVVIAYFRAGIWEDWRPDAASYPAALLGASVAGWSGERWVDIRNTALLRPLIEARLDLAVSKGFDGVEPSAVDGYLATTGFPLTAPDQIAFNEWLAQAAHARGLSIGLKNDRQQVGSLVDDFDWALEEGLFALAEAGLVQPFVLARKAVFDVEYSGNPAAVCPQASAAKVSVIFKTPVLGNEPPGSCSLTGVDQPAVSDRLRLAACPTPFNPRTTIRFDLPVAGQAQLSIYDLAGRLVRVIVEGEVPAGSHEAVWDGRDAIGRSAPSGSYLARLVAGGRVEGVRLSLVR
jgi:hypothetical protein